MIINIKQFMKDKGIEFQTSKQELNWIRKLKPDTLIRIGNSYFAEEPELNRLFQIYLDNQIVKSSHSLICLTGLFLT